MIRAFILGVASLVITVSAKIAFTDIVVFGDSLSVSGTNLYSLD